MMIQVLKFKGEKAAVVGRILGRTLSAMCDAFETKLHFQSLVGEWIRLVTCF